MVVFKAINTKDENTNLLAQFMHINFMPSEIGENSNVKYIDLEITKDQSKY